MGTGAADEDVTSVAAAIAGMSLNQPHDSLSLGTRAGQGPTPQVQQGGGRPSVLAGMAAAQQAVRELIAWPRLYSSQAAALGVQWPHGLLLHGPPGCGKSLLVRTVAEECGARLHGVSAADVFGVYVGESERRLREAFEAAAGDARQGHTSVVFLDEVDALCPRRDGGRPHESRVVAQLLTLMDGASSWRATTSSHADAQVQLAGGLLTILSAVGAGDEAPTGVAAAAAGKAGQGSSSSSGHLVVVAATNRPNVLDPALRRPGRLDREVTVSVPTTQERAEILGAHTAGLGLGPGVDLGAIAGGCHGYSGADLAALAREAALHALSTAAAAAGLLAPQAGGSEPQKGSLQVVDGQHQGTSPQSQGPLLTGADFTAAMRKVGPSITRGLEVEVPQTSWDDIGGLPDVKKRVRQAVEWPLKAAPAFQRLGLTPPRGVLLYGPPGCSKTSLARAAASASGATLLPLSCAQLFSMYVGEGEAMLRDVFARARLAAPAIVLLDEVDAVAARRSGDSSSESGSGEAGVRLLTTLLTEMDGMEAATGVLVLGATNRPQAVDAALMRPGRFDSLLYVPPPDEEGRRQVLRIHTRHMPLASDVDLARLAAVTAGRTGAELAGLCKEAALAALREDIAGATHVAGRHFESARNALRPPIVTAPMLVAYQQWASSHGMPADHASIAQGSPAFVLGAS